MNIAIIGPGVALAILAASWSSRKVSVYTDNHSSHLRLRLDPQAGLHVFTDLEDSRMQYGSGDLTYGDEHGAYITKLVALATDAVDADAYARWLSDFSPHLIVAITIPEHHLEGGFHCPVGLDYKVVDGCVTLPVAIQAPWYGDLYQLCPSVWEEMIHCLRELTRDVPLPA